MQRRKLACIDEFVGQADLIEPIMKPFRIKSASNILWLIRGWFHQWRICITKMGVWRGCLRSSF